MLTPTLIGAVDSPADIAVDALIRVLLAKIAATLMTHSRARALAAKPIRRPDHFGATNEGWHIPAEDTQPIVCYWHIVDQCVLERRAHPRRFGPKPHPLVRHQIRAWTAALSGVP